MCKLQVNVIKASCGEYNKIMMVSVGLLIEMLTMPHMTQVKHKNEASISNMTV